MSVLCCAARRATSTNQHALCVRYYRDRMSVPRGPCNVAVLRECWVQGVIDEHTLVWGQGLGDWLPVRNIRTLVPQIRTFEGAAQQRERSFVRVCDLLPCTNAGLCSPRSACGHVDKAQLCAEARAGAGA